MVRKVLISLSYTWLYFHNLVQTLGHFWIWSFWIIYSQEWANKPSKYCLIVNYIFPTVEMIKWSLRQVTINSSEKFFRDKYCDICSQFWDAQNDSKWLFLASLTKSNVQGHVVLEEMGGFVWKTPRDTPGV